MNKQKLFTHLSATMIFSVFFCFSVIGQNQDNTNKVADISTNGGIISWQIKQPFERATLTISTPNGEVLQREFKPNSIPNFSLISEKGESYGDGKFKYQIVLTPILSADVKKQLAQARQNGNSEEVADDLRNRKLLPESMMESGTFTVQNGSIVPIGGLETNAKNDGEAAGIKTTKTTPETASGDGDPTQTDDQVIADDLIVQGSACVGLDCVNNEDFGFDTLRLKENNLRIKFEDTSATGSFPSNDWQLTANDSASGGADKFSIEDITNNRTPFTITGGAPTNSFFVSNNGKIGFRTSTPVLDLHISTGDTPAFRFEQNSSGGFGAQTWDVAGNEANFFVRDATGGSRLPFRIFPGAATDSLRIEASGDVSIKNNIVYNGGGTSSVATPAAQQFYGGKATLVTTLSNISPTIDTNTFGITTSSQNGYATLLIDVPASLNLASTGASNIVYKIRYQDPDGGGTGSLVRLDVVANNIDTGARTTKIIFDSNTNAATGNNTVTVCQAVDSTYFNYATNGTHLYITLLGTSASNAKFFQVQVYKISTSC